MADPYASLISSTPTIDQAFNATLQVESEGQQFDKKGNPKKSSAGAIGIGQMLPSTGPEAAKLAGEEWDPYRFNLDADYNSKLSKSYFTKQAETFGDLDKAHAAYNAGPGATQKAIKKAEAQGGDWKDYLPDETKKYIPKIKSVLSKIGGGDKVSDKTLSDLIVEKPKEAPQTKVDPYAELLAQPTEDSKDPYASLMQGGKQDPYAEVLAQPQTLLDTFTSHFIAGVPQAMGGYGVGEAGAVAAEELIGVPLAPFTGGASLIVAPVVGSLLGYGVGSTITGKIERNLLPESVNKYLDEGAKQNEYSAFAGDIGSFGAVGGVSKPDTLKKGLILGAGGLGFEGFNQYREGKLDLTKLALSGLAMPFLGGKPTKLGELATLEPLRDTKTREAGKDLVKDYDPNKPYDEALKIYADKAKEEMPFDTWKEQHPEMDEQLSQEKYNEYINTAAEEQANSNPLFNIDNLNIPDIPKDYNGVEDFLYTIDNGRIVDDIRGGHVYDTTKITDQQKSALRLFTEGLHKDHIELTSQARFLDSQIANIKSSIRKDYNKWEADHPGQEPSAEFKKTVAERYAKMEAYNKESSKLRQEALKRTELSPEDRKIYDEVYTPLLESRRQGLQYLMDEGMIPKVDLKGDNFPRKLKAMSKAKQEEIDTLLRDRGLLEPEPNLWGKFKNYLGELAGGDMGGFNADLQRRRGATQERSLYVLDRADGKRDVIQVTKSGNVIKWENVNGEKVPSLLTRKVSPTDGSQITLTGQVKLGDKILDGVVKDGTMEEVEHHSPYEYNKDSTAVLINAVNDIREQVRTYEGIKNLTESDMFKKNSIKVGPGVVIPEGYRMPTHVDKIPALAGYAFPRKMAEVIEDFARVREPTLLTNLASILVKNMMMNPLPHMFNEAMHLYNARGLTGWVTPAGVYRFVKYGKQSMDSVLQQDEFYRDTIKLGGSLMAPGTRRSVMQESLMNKGVEEFSKTPDFKDLAATLGRTTTDLYNGISKQSNRAMWITRDIMYIQYLKELMATKGLSHPDAIKYAERHLPSYRLPSRIGEKYLGANLSRGISSTLQNPNITVFSRYHFGMVKSMIETAKDVGAIRKGKEGFEEFKEGMDTVAATAVALAVLYPMLDMVAQRITGNPDAQQRRAGPYHLIHAIGEVADGSKDPQAVLSSFFTFNPALQGLVQLGLDRNLYTGQQIYNPMSEPSIITKDILRYMVQQVPQAGQVMRAESDDSGEGGSVMGARQLDIESKTSTKQSKIDRMIRKLRKRAFKHDIKREEDIL
jgi:hypothetical protein